MSKYTDKKVSEMVKELEKGVTEMFTSEEYKRYLSTMAKFYSYSINNCIMIAIQKPEASYVAGYSDWNRKFERRVKAGEKGIRIFAPIVYKVKPETAENDTKDTGENEDTEKKIAAFKPAYVYDISQTEGKELPEICHELKADVKDFEKIKTAIEDTADCPISFKNIGGSRTKGYYSLTENKIVIRDKMPEMQTIKTMIHELAHSMLHCDTEKAKSFTMNEKEVQAESIAYVVSSFLNLDTSDYSFGYVTAWSKDKELKELKENAKIIKDTSKKIIESLAQRLDLIKLPAVSKSKTMKLAM